MTQSELIKKILKIKEVPTLSKILEEIIEDDKESQYKKDMQTSLNYFKNNNDILTGGISQKNVKGTITEQYWREKLKITNNFLQQIINEKVDYLLGKTPSITSENEQLIQRMNINTNILQQTAEYTRLFGKAFWYVYVNENGELKYTLMDSRELIPIYEKGKLVNMIRYYKSYANGNAYMKVEFYDENGYLTFNETKNGLVCEQENINNINIETGKIDIQNSLPYFADTDRQGNTLRNRNFGKIPFIEFKSNFTATPQLNSIKMYIDNIDILLSDASVDIKTFKEIYLQIAGFGGDFQDQSRVNDFFEIFRQYKALLVDEQGSAEIKTIEIPYEAKNWLITTLENIMYRIANSPRKQMEEKLGNLSGTALKILQNPLRQSVSKMAISIADGIKEFGSFASDFYNLKGDVSVTFNYNEMTNNLETIQALAMSQGIISKKTILENHPYVSDVEKELERLDKEINTDTFGVE